MKNDGLQKIEDRKQMTEDRKRPNFCFLFSILCSLPSVLCLLFSVTGCAKKEIKNIDSKGRNIICFGDSITFGYGADKDEDYPTALAKLIDIPVINAGIDSDTSTMGLERMDTDVLEKDPLLVIIEFGGNDFLKKIPIERTATNIKKMIDTIQAHGAMVALVDVSAGLLLKDYHEAFYKIARQENVIFIPGILGGIITDPKFKSDFIHPNNKGYIIIAQRVYDAILPYLKKNKLVRAAKP